MRVPVEWLKQYTEINVDIDDFAQQMIMSGSNIETVETFGVNFKNVVVGRVLTKEKHPDADKLSVCTVEVGQEEPVQIVCGAPNVVAGILVPVALHKSRIPGPAHGQDKKEGGIEITKGKLRGVVSMGMICSAEELGFMDKVIPTSHRDGIWILPEGLTVGEPIEEALGLFDHVVEFEITPNRADCLSMVGMAGETAATLGKTVTMPETELKEEGAGRTEDYIKVEIRNPESCKRYVARVVTDVKVQPSPWWMQRRLMYAGMRPINNIVDITNYVMLEMGNPIHAFDINSIEGGQIIVENAVDGEKFTTLDEKERTLDKDMLLIKDGKKPVALAGVMGGLNSEIKDDTNTILIEVANFRKDITRRTSKKLGLRTEASARYEKGVDPNLCGIVADRVCRLIEDLGVGKVEKSTVDVYPQAYASPTVQVRTSRVNGVLGTEIADEKIMEILAALKVEATIEGGVIKAVPPTTRPDLTTEEDFIEEVARIYGYDKLPTTLPKGNKSADMGERENLRRMAAEAMCAMGANEIQTYSFVSPKDVEKINIDEDSWEYSFVRITNPLGEENSVMRTVLTPAMLNAMSYNYARNLEEMKAFEIGSTFVQNMVEEGGLPEEQESMAIGMYGKKYDFFTMKGMVTELLGHLGIRDLIFEKETDYGVYHPGRCARILIKGKDIDQQVKERLLKEADKKVEGTEDEVALMNQMVNFMAQGLREETVEIGIMGEVHPDVAANYGIDTRCYCCELMFNVVKEFAHTEIAYHPLPKYPSTARDIALVVDEQVAVGAIKSSIKKAGGIILEDVKLFDIYRGEQVEAGKKSAAFRLTYRAMDKTLTDEEVAPVHEGVLQKLKEDFEAVLREV